MENADVTQHTAVNRVELQLTGQITKTDTEYKYYSSASVHLSVMHSLVI